MSNRLSYTSITQSAEPYKIINAKEIRGYDDLPPALQRAADILGFDMSCISRQNVSLPQYYKKYLAFHAAQNRLQQMNTPPAVWPGPYRAPDKKTELVELVASRSHWYENISKPISYIIEHGNSEMLEFLQETPNAPSANTVFGFIRSCHSLKDLKDWVQANIPNSYGKEKDKGKGKPIEAQVEALANRSHKKKKDVDIQIEKSKKKKM